MANEIVSELRLELDKFRADLKQAQQDAEKAGKSGGEGFGNNLEKGFSLGAGKLIGGIAAIGSALAGAFTLKASIAAASEQETAINALNSSLALAGNFTAKASADFQAFAGALQKTTTAADETIVQGGALIATMGKLSGETLNRATAASLDLAAALNIDQATAFNMVAKAASGHVTALGRYGIEVKKTGDDSRDFAVALGELENSFRGMAALQTNTFSGAMAQTKNQFGEILESLGNIVIKSPAVIAVLKLSAETFASLAKSIEDFAKGRDLISEFSTVMIDFGKAMITWVVAPLELLYNVGVVVFNGLKMIVQTAVLAIATYLTGLTGMLALVSDKFAGMHEGVKMFAAGAKETLMQFAGETQASADGIFNFDASAKAEQYLGQMQTFVDNVKPITVANFKGISDAAAAGMAKPTMFSAFADSFMEANARVIAGAKNLGAQIHATIGQGVTNSFAAMGAAMAKGENGFAAFGKAMVGVLGDIAIQAGSTFIALGIAKAIASLGSDPSAYALIAAGAALSILGGALKAYAGSGGGGGGPASGGAPSGASTSGGGGGVASSGGSGTAPADTQATSFNDSQRGEVGTKVEVNVQGNVFDRRETGLMIADTINEAFGSNGITFAGSNS
jgi:hypothetical protein